MRNVAASANEFELVCSSHGVWCCLLSIRLHKNTPLLLPAEAGT